VEWLHTALGRFDIAEQWVGLDFSKLFLDPVRADTTLFHEVTHSLIGRTTEMGQATQNIFFFLKEFKHLSDDQQDAVITALVGSQKFVQEGFATFMEMQRMRQLTSWDAAMARKADMHPEYLERFERMEFIYNMSHKQRERYTKKISQLVMQNGMRRDAQRLDLLRSPDQLQAYLADPDNNPSMRLEKVLAAIRTNDRILIKKPRQIAKIAGIKYHEPATPQEICDYVNYLLGLAGLPQEYGLDLVGKTVPQDALIDSFDNLLVTNMNLQLAENGNMLWKTEDIDYEAQYAHAVFAVYHTRSEATDVVEPHMDRKFEVSLIMFRNSGEKYLAITSKEHADQLLLDQLKDATLITKWGICNPVDSSFTITDKRKPDLINYNRPVDMLVAFEQAGTAIKKYEYIHMGAMQDHPYQSLLVKINGNATIHYVNGFGNASISKVIEYMKPKAHNLKPKELESHAKAINDGLAMMGLPWDVDWVKTMVSQKEIFRR
jgi:hypothetical protein